MNDVHASRLEWSAQGLLHPPQESERNSSYPSPHEYAHREIFECLQSTTTLSACNVPVFPSCRRRPHQLTLRVLNLEIVSHIPTIMTVWRRTLTRLSGQPCSYHDSVIHFRGPFLEGSPLKGKCRSPRTFTSSSTLKSRTAPSPFQKGNDDSLRTRPARLRAMLGPPYSLLTFTFANLSNCGEQPTRGDKFKLKHAALGQLSRANAPA